MKRIAAFVDFTEGCKIALKQAAVVAKATGAELYAVYILTGDDNTAAKEEELWTFTQTVPGLENIKVQVGTGDLLDGAAQTLRFIHPDLVVVGTHGIKGIKQHLFGAHILKLVEAIPFPSIVVQENTVVRESGFKHILFPVSAHPEFQVQSEQTAKIAAIFQSEIVQYEIAKGPAMDDTRLENTRQATAYLESHQIRSQYVLEEATVVSVGNSRQALKYAAENNMDLISSMAEVAPNDISLGRPDMENLLTNPQGIPILCCHS
jgi:nucleotide-binding universal stress UspA family protein